MAKLKDVKPGTKITLRRDVNTLERKPVSASLGCHIIGIAPPHCDPEDPVTLAAGAVKRFTTDININILSKELMDFTLDTLKGWSAKGLNPLKAGTYDLEEWLAVTSYPNTRKEQLREAYKQLGDKTLEDIMQVNMFMKDEFTDEFKHARLINSRSDYFKVLTGPMFKALEKQLFSLEYFVKNIPVNMRSKEIFEALYSPGSKAYAGDYTAFESHFKRLLMTCIEFVFYSYMLPPDKEGETFMSLVERLMGKNVCKSKFMWVVVWATRMSGEMNTSLANSLANLIIWLFICHKSGVSTKVRIEGDDSIATTSGPIDTDVIRKMGLNFKLETHDKLNEMSFCGIVHPEETYEQVTDPLKVLCRFGWSHMTYCSSNSRTLRNLAFAKALSYMYQFPQLPIVRPYCDYVIRTILKLQQPTKRDLRKIIKHETDYRRQELMEAIDHYYSGKVEPFNPSVHVRELVDRKYQIDVSIQKHAESVLNSLTEFKPVELDMLPFRREYYIMWDQYVGIEAPVVEYCHPDERLDALKKVGAFQLFSSGHKKSVQKDCVHGFIQDMRGTTKKGKETLLDRGLMPRI